MKKRKIVTTGTIRMEKRASMQSYASKCVKSLRKKATPYEKRFYTMLRVKYPSVIFQKPFIRPEGLFIVDFFLPYKGIVIELDGCQHYQNDKSMRKDAIRDNVLRDLGYKIIRLKNKEIDYVDIDLLLKQAV